MSDKMETIVGGRTAIEQKIEALNDTDSPAWVMLQPSLLAPCLRNLNTLKKIIDSNSATYDEKLMLASVGIESILDKMTNEMLMLTDKMRELIKDVDDDADGILARYRENQRAQCREQ